MICRWHRKLKDLWTMISLRNGDSGCVEHDMRETPLGMEFTGDYLPGLVVVHTENLLKMETEQIMPKTTTVKHLPKNHDMVNNPSHYMSPFPLKVVYLDQATGAYYTDVISVITAWGLQTKAYMFNLIKYVLRGGQKDDNPYLQELQKSRWYLDAEIEEVENSLQDSASNGGN